VADFSATEINTIDQMLANILDRSALDFIEKALGKYIGDTYKDSDFSLIEKINLILALAAQNKITISSRLLKTVKGISVSLARWPIK
jgi:hypothetical protein